MEHTIDKKLKAHVFSCFKEDDYLNLKQNKIEYTNVKTLQVYIYIYIYICIYGEYDENNKSTVKRGSGGSWWTRGYKWTVTQSIHNQTRTTKAISSFKGTKTPDGIYLKKCLWINEKSICINKDVFKWRAQSVNQCTIALCLPFFKEAQKKQRLKNQQGNKVARIAMLQGKIS